MADKPSKADPSSQKSNSRVSRRDFLKMSGISAVALPLWANNPVESDGAVPVFGPGKAPIELLVNGKTRTLELEPRITLLDALRDNLGITGAKRVCDRGECGACTVLLNGKAVYACSVLAIEAQDQEVLTVESLVRGGTLHPIQQAFVEADATQCGFCTPGFVVAAKALLDSHQHPTPEELRRGLSGNLCRCGTYDGIRNAIARATMKEGRDG